MYLSRLLLNSRSRRVQQESADLYQMHRSVMCAFPETLPEEERVLYRLDSIQRTGALTLLVQSINQPDWSWLQEPKHRGYLLPSLDPNPWVKPFDPLFSKGQWLAFRLRANPTVKRDGKRRGLFQEEEQQQWLLRKAQDGGFTVEVLRIQEHGTGRGALFRENHRHELRLLAIQFEGVLQVTNPGRFLDTLQNGVGSGKGLGFGLLSVGPMQ